MSLVLLGAQVLLLSGCTAALWEKDRFAQYRRPAVPNHLRLGYSEKRKDVLVQYEEARDEDKSITPRAYWLEPNCPRVMAGSKPKFVLTNEMAAIVPVPVAPTACTSAPPILYATASDNSFTLYSGSEQLNVYSLPVYKGSGQRTKQVLLTPFAVAVDLTIVGAIVALHFHYTGSP